MIYIKVLSAIGLLWSIGWVIADPGFEPALGVVGSISALVSAFVVEERNTRRAEQRQSVSNSSIGVQASGDVNIGHIGRDKDAK